MMKLGQWGRRFFIPRLISDDSTAAATATTRVLFFSTESLTSSASTSSSTSSSRSWSCFEKRISAIKDPKVSIIPYLNEWIEKGGKYDKFELSELVDRMHQRERYQHAFEVSRWMGDPKYNLLTPDEVEVRLDLIYKVRGLEHAERYFSSIPLLQQTTSLTCCALLNCYVEEKSNYEKAEIFVQKMKKLGLVITNNFYQLLTILYIDAGQRDKADILFHEMNSNDFPLEEFTIIHELTAYVYASDVGRMERVLDQMEKDPEFYVDWTMYAIMADGYLKAGSESEPGLIDKALKMMKKVEKMTIKPESSLILEFLLTLYTRVGKKEELYRLWNLHKSSGRLLQSTSYSTMITSLSEFDDIDGAENIFQEWESTSGPCVGDLRVLNPLVTAYRKKGLLEKAESVGERVVKKAAECSEQASYDASTWNVLLATGYLGEKRMPKSVEMFNKAMLVGRGDWVSCVDSCLDYFEEQGDIEEAQEFVKLLGSSAHLIHEFDYRLLRIYGPAWYQNAEIRRNFLK